ncbi:heavy-metal-associated domain-containing protein [Hespellia stercorisuis]|uniref:Copper chaperone CopZ n=1 Tax=Hespellia stercorisuis DSM 15480 TaxID=1121950 RepID=A0A1M6PAL1_9FIRM|nr:heavy metal-associated domain-containing protein [Hespellia stercorisuis]SHK04983.1 Copper chaperone CopZ [Hespellia stercorisuis DSM 15480]
MGNVIIIIILAVVVFLAVRGSVRHFKGEGGCCGGCAESRPEKKELAGEKTVEKIIHIEGMHCENCRNSVERQINRIEGAAARVDLKKNIAIVSMDREISDEELKRAVESIDFKVTGIAKKEV